MKIGPMINYYLNEFNRALSYQSKYRYEARITKNNMLYLYDYDDEGFSRVIRSKSEIKDILSCMNLNEYEKEKELMYVMLQELGVI